MAEQIDNDEQVTNPDGTENLKVLENIDVNHTKNCIFVESGRLSSAPDTMRRARKHYHI